MDNYELNTNRVERLPNGRFAPHHTPWCKGKKWEQIYNGNEKRIERMKKVVVKNITAKNDANRKRGWENSAKTNSKPVVLQKDGEELFFKSASDASVFLGKKSKCFVSAYINRGIKVDGYTAFYVKPI